MHDVLVLHGPNLNLLGTREPEIYGSTTLADLEAQISRWGESLGVRCSFFQSNHEGALIDALHEARHTADAVIVNAGALSHYSYALYDALIAIEKPIVEVHISNINAREAWRRHSVTAAAAGHSIYGRGIRGYHDALKRLIATAAVAPERISYGKSDSQFGELRVPSGPGHHRVAALFHGGFWHDVWTLDLMDALAIDLHTRGWATWNVEYRRLGSGGGWPLTMEDVAAAIDHLVKLGPAHNLDLDAVAAVGHSAGGQLALWAAARPELNPEQPHAKPLLTPGKVVALAPVADMKMAYDLNLDDGAVESFLRRTPTTGPKRFAAASPIELLPLATRQLVIHGDADDRVPAAMSRNYAQAATAAGDDVTLRIVEGADHFTMLEPDSAAWGIAVEWLDA